MLTVIVLVIAAAAAGSNALLPEFKERTGIPYSIYVKAFCTCTGLRVQILARILFFRQIQSAESVWRPRVSCRTFFEVLLR